ncbi:alpha/beta hydrolase [Streptomyces enissocaesilis]|uniref:Alpha/beta hydrolase n=1 Tax=Streptomyces enissocaesilis TaxID=332589 RepID=A0ABP6K8D8_9ACTN
MTTSHNPICPNHTGGTCLAATPRDPVDVTLLFLHGMGVTARSWDQVRQRLPADWRTVAYDQRGHGHSAFGLLPPTGLAQLGADLADILTHPGSCLPGPVVLVGHSAGGIVLMHCAATHPDLFGTRVVGAVLLSTTAAPVDLTCGVKGPAGLLLGRLFLQAAGAPPDRITARTSLAVRLSSLLVRIMTRSRWPLYGHASTPATRRACSEMISATEPATLSALLHQLSANRGPEPTGLSRVPVLIGVGSEDRLTPPSHSRDLARRLPHAHLFTAPRAGHVLPLEAPDLVTRKIRDLLPLPRRE